MKLLNIFLFLFVGTLYGQSLIITSECEPQTYNSQPRLYSPDLGDCRVEFVGPLYRTFPTEGKVYTTLQVMVGKVYHEDLPLGFGSHTTHINTYYMNPYLYEVIGHEAAVQRAINSGFPCPKVVTILAQNEFSGFRFN